jgi:hypothetical protein
MYCTSVIQVSAAINTAFFTNQHVHTCTYIYVLHMHCLSCINPSCTHLHVHTFITYTHTHTHLPYKQGIQIIRFEYSALCLTSLVLVNKIQEEDAHGILVPCALIT